MASKINGTPKVQDSWYARNEAASGIYYSFQLNFWWLLLVHKINYHLLEPVEFLMKASNKIPMNEFFVQSRAK